MARTWEAAFQTNSAEWYCVDLTSDSAIPAGEAVAEVDFGDLEEVIRWLGELRSTFRWVWVEQELKAARDNSHVYGLLRVGRDRAGYIKIGLGHAYVADFEQCLRIPPASAFIYDTFVHPDHRGRGLALFMVGRALAALRARGIRRVWCHIPAWNHPSINVYMKSGFGKAAHIRHVRLFGRGFRSCSPEKLMQRRDEVGVVGSARFSH